MAFENLFIRTQKTLGGIQLDAVLSETHNSEVRVTRNPIETGANITDHSYSEPKSISIIAQVSDTPLGLAAFGQIIDLVSGLFGTATAGNITRSNAAYNALVQLQDQREPIDIQTKLKLYRNMIITKVNTSQDKDTSRSVLLSISAEEVIIVDSEIVTISADQIGDATVSDQAVSAAKRGRQEVVEAVESTQRSVLKTVSDWVTQ